MRTATAIIPSASPEEDDVSELESVRLDVWLDVACVFKTRSKAQNACRLGRVTVNGDRGKSHRAIRPGDEIRISLAGGAQRILEVVGLADTHLPRAEARALYVDRTPQPTAEELELRRMQRLAAPPTRPRGAGAPKKKERRQLRRAKEWDFDD
jgi:ribosome-associated heat shock protein Hsp15